MEKLFEEFESVNLQQWLDKIETDLKGKPLDVLNSKAEMDLTIKAFHHQDEIETSNTVFTKEQNNWSIRRNYTDETNQEILTDLNDGVDALGFTYGDSFAALTKNVLFEHLLSDVKFTTSEEAVEAEVNAKSNLNFDVFALGLKSGDWQMSNSDFINFFKAKKEHKSLWISGSIYGEAGATSTQELAFIAAHLNEYIQLLVNEGIDLETINSKICIEISVTDNYFVNLAKMRIIRSLVRGVFEAYDKEHKHSRIVLYANTSGRYLAINDANNNLLRQTTQAMSAVLGGCDVLTIQPIESKDTILYKRMAKNIQLILKEEAYLDKVVDPSEGSYYLESLSNELLKNSWELFKSIEKIGGFCAAIENNHIQDLIETNKEYLVKQLNNKEKTFLGVNKYPSTAEDWKKAKFMVPNSSGTFEALTAFKLEAHYNQNITA